MLYPSVMHQSFVSTAPPPTGIAGIVTFQSPGISPTLWGQADGNNPTLSSLQVGI